MKKNSRNVRQGIKRHKRKEKRARKAEKLIRKEEHKRDTQLRRQKALAICCRKAISLSRVGRAVGVGAYKTWGCDKDGIGTFRYTLYAQGLDDFGLIYRWQDIPAATLRSIQGIEWNPYLPKSPLERVAECAI